MHCCAKCFGSHSLKDYSCLNKPQALVNHEPNAALESDHKSSSKNRTSSPILSHGHSSQKRLNECKIDANDFKANLADHETDQHASFAGALPSSVSQKVFQDQINLEPTGRYPSRSNLDQELPATSLSHPKKFLRDGPVVIEMFASSGRFTAALKACGVHSAFGVDHKKLSSIAPIMIADLTSRTGQSLFMTWMEAPNLAEFSLCRLVERAALHGTSKYVDQKEI